MPRKAKVSEEEAIAVIRRFIDYFKTNDLPKVTSQIWIQISKCLEGKWSARDVYHEIRENRRNILSEARLRENVKEVTNTTLNDTLITSSDNEEHKESSGVESESNSLTTFRYLIMCGSKFPKQRNFGMEKN